MSTCTAHSSVWRHTLIKKHTQTELSDPGRYPAFPCCDSCERSHALPSPSTPLFSCFPLCLVFFLFLPLFSLFYNSLRCFSFVLGCPICMNNFISKIIKKIQPYFKLFVNVRAAFEYFMVSQGQVSSNISTLKYLRASAGLKFGQK